jgi:large subunit ribosomal protein L30
MAKVKVTLVRSPIGSPERHKRTVAGLGLRRLQSSRVHDASMPVLGMIKQVAHLVHIEEVAEEA